MSSGRTSATVLGVATVGYARVSTDHQLLDQQRDALNAAGCERVFTDQMSGVREDRPGLVALLDYVRDGDVVVSSPSTALAGPCPGVIRTIETLTEAGVLLRSLREGIDYSTATGRMLAGIFAALAAHERELMHERAAAARATARARGKHSGRPAKLTKVQVRQVRTLRAGGESISELVAGFGVCRAMVYRALREDTLAQAQAQAGAQAWGVGAGGDELRAAQDQVALARSLGGQSQAVAELELGLQEVGLQPVDRVGIQPVLAQRLCRRSGEGQARAELAVQRRLVLRFDGRVGQAGVDQRHRR